MTEVAVSDNVANTRTCLHDRSGLKFLRTLSGASLRTPEAERRASVAAVVQALQ